jgi:hypothetical protein
MVGSGWVGIEQQKKIEDLIEEGGGRAERFSEFNCYAVSARRMMLAGP